jgi:hypothetical protein
MSPESPESPTIIFGQPGNEESRKSSMYIDTGLADFPGNRTQVDRWAREGVKQIKLGPSASKALTESGQSVFALVSRQRWPDDPQRWAIYLLPVPLALARQAEGVVLGSHKATRIKAAPMPGGDAKNGTPAPPPPGASGSLAEKRKRTLPGRKFIRASKKAFWA